MDISIFQEYQDKSENRYMCINTDHAMPLVPYKNLDLKIELKCFVGFCDYKVIPGIAAYEKIIKELKND